MTNLYHNVPRRSVLKGGFGLAVGLGVTLKAPAMLAQDKSLSLMVLGPDQKATAWLKIALEEFKAKTGYEVELRQSDWGSAFQKLLTATASGTLADVCMMGQVMTPALASKGAFLPIDSYLKGWVDAEQFYAPMLKDGIFDGKSYALPIYADVRTSIYRSDILKKAGVETLPTNWDEFKALAKKLSTKNGGPLDAPFFANQDKSVGLMQTFSQFLVQAGGSYFDEKGKSILSAEPGQKALNYLVSFFAEGLANPNVVYQGTGPTPLVQGQAAMTLNSVFEPRNAHANNPEVEKFVIAGAPLSATPGGKPATLAWINKLGIGANTKDPDGAWQLLSYLVSKSSSEKFAELWGGLPARQDLKDAPFLANVDKGFVDATQYAGALPTTPSLLQIQKEVNIAMQSAIRQAQPPAEILSALDTKIDEITGS
ncbi:extracellular solute-binding protein family 1 (plasmid) [Rhizobium leguminosarum bv. trifolii WSM2304]|uniref:Extracellular solute-binding protein family 1 n=1 Tax=Rhizobium leguminosarum bv. trifolii (strain WSM2304) TaxID=395492 RepID=A0ABF7QZB5_RHILW|nr:ABC transporter substrate-binding protein [Rhizobium leguminosarum]ACI59480.1 extracellular solute-binding protein family 1 [Rhizobium leguminosarum bv. trifolii WSM2304]